MNASHPSVGGPLHKSTRLRRRAPRPTSMAPNNALGKPTAAAMRASAEGRASRSPARRRVAKAANASDQDVRKSTSDAFGAGDPSMLGKSEVASRGTGSAVRTPLDEFEARPRNEIRCIFTCIMFLTRLPCPGWCVKMWVSNGTPRAHRCCCLLAC